MKIEKQKYGLDKNKKSRKLRNSKKSKKEFN